MYFYLSVAIGGALGSVARAWAAIAVARITGPQFPWGTILINIVGSFVIGFFGTLTANDSRFPLPTDVRAFVMVGVCGGFTTFSSFSLQTLELARDGRMAQAFGNVGLSVLLCLLAVTAGYYAASAVPSSPVRTGAAGETSMGEVVVAVMNQPNDAEVLLDAATQYLEIVGGGTLKALAIRMPPMATILPSEEVLTSAREAAIRQQQERWSGQLRTIVDAWSPRAARHGVRTECVEIEGDAADVVVQQGWHADAVVVARPTSHDTPRMHDCMHAALFETGCPVLVVPPEFEGPLGQVVAIAWKDDPRAAAAVRASLPLLSKARQVYVLRAGASVEPPSILMEHDIKADITVVPDGEGTVGERILHAAHQFGVDLLVMGAFSHTQWRERLFGGVTRTMFAKADIPLLMRH